MPDISQYQDTIVIEFTKYLGTELPKNGIDKKRVDELLKEVENKLRDKRGPNITAVIKLAEDL